uniref:Ig-like domain-containing protein n=1 Tax=Oreochromis niloticus TaxID=8128 RepID=A0A669DXM8_ORENI
ARCYCSKIHVHVRIGFFSQHALAVVVEVNEGEDSVLLPCQFSGLIPLDPTVTWTRNDLNPKSVHVRQEQRDDLRGQNQGYSWRTSMRPDALETGDFSLTLKNLQLTDSGKYTCTLSNERNEVRVGDVHPTVIKPNMSPVIISSFFVGKYSCCI